MKGSVLALVGCLALFFAAPSHSYSISEDDRLANRQSADDATPGDAVGNTGESETVKTDGGANPGDEPVAGDGQAEKSKSRKRDTRSLVEYEVYSDETDMPPVSKENALSWLRRLGKYGGQCFEKFFDYIEEHELTTTFLEEWNPTGFFTTSDMVKWLEIMKDSVSECLTNSVDQLISEIRWPDDYVLASENWDTIVDESEFFSPLTDMGKRPEKCLEDAIRHLNATWYGPGDTVQRSSESSTDLLTELIEILPLINGGAVPAGDTIPMYPPGQMVPPQLDSVPVMTSYKKRNSPDKPRGYGHYPDLPVLPHPRHVHAQDIPNPVAPQLPGLRGEMVQRRSPPPPRAAFFYPFHRFSLLDIVLDQIYSKLQGNVPPAVNTEAAPVEGLMTDANCALGLSPGNGESPDTGDLVFNCAHKRLQ